MYFEQIMAKSTQSEQNWVLQVPFENGILMRKIGKEPNFQGPAGTYLQKGVPWYPTFGFSLSHFFAAIFQVYNFCNCQIVVTLHLVKKK